MIQTICDILDIDYEEIKDKLPKDEEQVTKLAEQDLNKLVSDDGGDPGE